MKVMAVLLAAFVVVIPAEANEDAVRRYRDYTPQQLRNLPEEQLKSDVPIMYTMAAQRGLSVGSELLFGMELNRLMYSGLHDYESAVKAFQSDLGDEPTGTLTVWQIHQLERRSEMQKLSRVLFPEQYSSYITEEYASVQGTMLMVDEKIAWPINHVRVECVRSEGQCKLDQIYLSVPDKNSWSQNYHVWEDDTQYYEIARWSRDSIESHPVGTSSDCRSTSMSFNFKMKEFYYITRNEGGDCRILDFELERLAKPRIAQIVDGAKIIQEEFAKVDRAAYEVLATNFRKRVDHLSADEQSK